MFRYGTGASEPGLTVLFSEWLHRALVFFLGVVLSCAVSFLVPSVFLIWSVVTAQLWHSRHCPWTLLTWRTKGVIVEFTSDESRP